MYYFILFLNLSWLYDQTQGTNGVLFYFAYIFNMLIKYIHAKMKKYIFKNITHNFQNHAHAYNKK
jgi:hypothetical protein